MLRSGDKLGMKTLLVLAGMLITNAWLYGQAPASTRAACSKNVTFAVTAGGQPVATVPGFAAELISSQKHQPSSRGVCFSQSPDPRAKNYVVVFSSQKENFEGLVPSVLKYVNSTPLSEDSAIKAVYGEMWHYSANQSAGDSDTTANIERIESGSDLYVRAYNEQGVVVSEGSLKSVSGWFHTRQKLLEHVIADISADTRQVTGPSPSLKTSLPVYYVNCDVPVKSLAGTEPNMSPHAEPAAATAAPTPPPAPPPVTVLEFSSTPPGADVFLDGQPVGKTPSTLTTVPGNYTITMSKQDFGTWQRKLQVEAGKRRVSASLQQRALNLDFSSHPNTTASTSNQTAKPPQKTAPKYPVTVGMQ
jgi:hypothetical protein